MFVVLVPPLAYELTNPLQASKQVKIQQLVSQAAVEAFDEGILLGLAGFDVVVKDAIGSAPLDQDAAKELRPMIYPGHVRHSLNLFQTLKHTLQPSSSLIEVSISITSDSRLKSSMTLNSRYRDPW